jgi:hypothetical protein
VEKRNECRTLVEKPEGKRRLGRARYRWEDILKSLEKLGEVVWNRFFWIRMRANGPALVTR